MTLTSSGIPAHKIYTGSFANLELCWIKTVLELQHNNPLREIGVLVGSNILASYLKRRLAESGRITANIRFFTFLDLAGHLGGASGAGAEKPRLPQLAAPIILEDLLEERTPAVYASMAGYKGFRDALLETFRDLRDAGFTPEALETAIEQGRNRDRRPHLRAFADLYRRFRERVGFFADVDDDFRAAIRNASAPNAFASSRHLLVYGIYDATGQQVCLLNALKQHVAMIYFIPFVNASVSEFTLPFLESRAATLNVAPHHLDANYASTGVASLADAGFGFGPNAKPGEALLPDGSYALVSVPGESRAAVEIAREILRALRDGTIRAFHEAAVILRQPESDIPILSEMFRLRNIPYFIHGGRSFTETLLGRAIGALSRLESHFSREAVLTALDLAAAALPEVTVAGWDVQGWRALANNPRFLAGLGAWDAGMEAMLDAARADLRRAEGHASGFAGDEEKSGMRSGYAAHKRFEAATRFYDAWRLLRQAAVDWPTALSWHEWAVFLEKRFKPLFGEAEDWPLFSSVLDEIGGLDAMTPPRRDSETAGGVPAGKLRAALLEAMARTSCPVGRFQRSGVNILSTSAARGLRFPLVIIPGLDEGRFPAKLRQDPLLLDAERLSMGTLPVKFKRAEEEKLLFDMAARSANKRLVLMTSRLDESSDREKIPSQFFLRTASAICGRAVTTRDLIQGTIPGFRSVSLDNPAPAKDEIPVDGGEIRLRIVSSEPSSARQALQALAELEPLRLRRPLLYDRARWERRLTSFDGCISDPQLVRWTAQEISAAAGQVSASRLEEYVKCPYSFFLKRVMNLQEWEEEGTIEGIDPLERGLIIHSVLEQFLRMTGESGFIQRSEEQLTAELEELARKTLEQARPAGLADLLWEIERDSLLTMLKQWVVFEKSRMEPGSRIAGLEQAFGEFGPDEKNPPLRLTAGRHTFEFRGRIDRIDISEDRQRARVIDYKTGALPDSMAGRNRTPLMSGERIQIVVYAGALSVVRGFEDVKAIEGEYLHLQPRNGSAVPCSFAHEELSRASRELLTILEAVGDGFETGAFFARTSGKMRPSGHCGYCAYLPICGKDRAQREERKAGDSAVKKLLQVVEPL